MWVGIAVTVVSGLLMYLAWQSGGYSFWFACTWFPFLLGVGVMAMAWSSRTARWLHVRIHQPSGEWPKKGTNASFFKNETLDQLLDAARSTANPKERKRLYKEAMGLIVEEAPWIFLYSEMEFTGVRANVKDIVVQPTEGIIANQARIE